MFIKIGGVPAAGKTTISKILVDCLRAAGYEAETVHGAKILADVLGVTVDELRRLPKETREAARPEMFRRIYEEDRNHPGRIWVRDAHFSLYEPTVGKFTIFPIQEGDKLQMKAMIVLEAPAGIIKERRLSDGKQRQDRVLDPNIIRQEIDRELAVDREQSLALSIPLITIGNYGRTPQEICTDIVQRLKVEVFSDLEIMRGGISLERVRRL